MFPIVCSEFFSWDNFEILSGFFSISCLLVVLPEFKSLASQHQILVQHSNESEILIYSVGISDSSVRKFLSVKNSRHVYSVHKSLRSKIVTGIYHIG